MLNSAGGGGVGREGGWGNEKEVTLLYLNGCCLICKIVPVILVYHLLMQLYGVLNELFTITCRNNW